MNNLLMMHPEDNVAVCLTEGKTGDTVAINTKDGKEAGSVDLLDEVPFAHKVALVDFTPGEHVFKYGEIIGAASVEIKAGQWVHTHNMEGLRGRGDKQ